MGPQFRQKTGIQCHEAHEGIDTISMYLTSISFKNALLFHRRYEKLKAENSPTHFQIMPTPKQTTSKSTSTKKRDVLRPIQAKRFASQYPLLDNPANLPIDQVQSLLITALRGDIQQLKHQVKALEEIGANVFALTWNVNHLHKSSRFKDDVFMAKADICEVVMLVEVTDSVIYFAKNAKSEAPQIFEEVVNSYEFDWTARLQGQAVAHKS